VAAHRARPDPRADLRVRRGPDLAHDRHVGDARRMDRGHDRCALRDARARRRDARLRLGLVVRYADGAAVPASGAGGGGGIVGAGGAGAAGAPLDPPELKSTRGAAETAARSVSGISKNSSSLNPKLLATNREGNDCTRRL